MVVAPNQVTMRVADQVAMRIPDQVEVKYPKSRTLDQVNTGQKVVE